MERILEKINKAGLQLLESLSLSQTYGVIINSAAKLLGADWGGLYLVDDGELVQKACFPLASHQFLTVRRRGFTYTAYARRKTFVIHKKEINRVHPELEKRKYGSAICIPLSDHKASIGALTLLSYEDKKFTTKELHLLKVFGAYASLAIKKAHFQEEIKNALEIRDMFIAMAAHELRTPLTTINGYAQLLQSKLGGDKSTYGAWVDQMVSESKRFVRLVNELLEVNRIKSGEFHYVFKEHSLSEIVLQSIERFKVSHLERKIQFGFLGQKNSDMVICDKNKILQVIDNVLDNAAKFSLSNTFITIRCRTTVRWVYIHVKDQGIGIAKKDLRKVFEEFYKKTRGTEKGMGLGLFLTKHIVEVHKGAIRIIPHNSKGTEVEIKIPKAYVTRKTQDSIAAFADVPLMQTQ